MRELVCCFCHEIDVETNLCADGAYHAKSSKNDVKHVPNLTKKWIDMAKQINDDVLFRKLSDGDVAGKELNYHKLEVKACLQTFKRQYDQALRKSERSTHDGNNDTHWIKVNALNTVYSFMFEEKCQGAEVFHAKDFEKIYLEILSEHGIQYESHTSRFASLLVSNNDNLEKRNIGSKITICFTACADTIFKDMMDPGTIIRSMRDVVRPLRKLIAEKKNSFNGTFDINCQLKSIPIQLLTLVNMLIDGRACTTVSQASLSVAQLIFSSFKQVPGRNAAAFCRDNLDHETPLKLYNSLKMISDERSKKLVENSHGLGLGASYSRARNVIKDLSKLSTYQYHINGVFTPKSLKKECVHNYC